MRGVPIAPDTECPLMTVDAVAGPEKRRLPGPSRQGPRAATNLASTTATEYSEKFGSRERSLVRPLDDAEFEF